MQDLIQTYNPTVFTMKPQINLQNNGQEINQQLLKGRVSELKAFLKQIGEKPWIEEGRSQSVTYLATFPKTFEFILKLLDLLLLFVVVVLEQFTPKARKQFEA